MIHPGLLRLLACCAVLLIPLLSSAQFGIGGRYVKITHGYWQEAFESINGTYNDQASSIYATYWFRLKEKRVEFLPEAGYYRSFSRSVTSGYPNTLRAFYFRLNTNVYLLDFGSDCNCPTFSKQNDVIKRGFFVELSPGVEMRKFDVDYLDDGQMLATRTFKKTVPTLYGGIGLDIGLSDLITVTPNVGLTYAIGTAWDGLEDFLDVPQHARTGSRRDEDLIFNAGVRIMFRPDYVSGRRR